MFQRRNHLKLGITGLALLLLLTGCGHEAEEKANYHEASLASSVGSQFNVAENPRLKNFIVFDVLGGMFRGSTIDSQGTLFDKGGDTKVEGMTLSKTSLSLPPPSTPAAVGNLFPLEEGLNIDTSLSYSGAGGHGSLTIVATGSGRQRRHSTTDEKIRYYDYDPLTLRFLFFSYAYFHPCLGKIRLDGEVHCTIEGTYDSWNPSLEGEAICQNGPLGNPMTLLYITSDVNFEVSYRAQLEIDGNPFRFDSYTVTGDVEIDGEPLRIEDFIEAGASCSYY